MDIIEGRNASNIVQVNDIDELLLDDSDEEGSANYHLTEKSSDTPTRKSSNVSDRTADSVVESDGINAKESPLVWIPSDIDLEKSIKNESPKLKSTSTTVFLNPDLSKAFDNINTNRNDSTETNNDRIIANTDIGNKNDDKSEGRSNESHSSGQLKMTIKAKPKNRGPKSRKRPNDTCTESDSEKHEANKKIRKEYELSNDDNNRDLSESNNLEKENLEVNLSQDVESDVDPDDLAYDNMENEFKSSNNTLDKADEEATTPMDVDDTYICMNCSPLLVLRGADGIVDHSTIQEDHVDIRPLWLFNQVRNFLLFI